MYIIKKRSPNQLLYNWLNPHRLKLSKEHLTKDWLIDRKDLARIDWLIDWTNLARIDWLIDWTNLERIGWLIDWKDLARDWLIDWLKQSRKDRLIDNWLNWTGKRGRIRKRVVVGGKIDNYARTGQKKGQKRNNCRLPRRKMWTLSKGKRHMLWWNYVGLR